MSATELLITNTWGYNNKPINMQQLQLIHTMVWYYNSSLEK